MVKADDDMAVSSGSRRKSPQKMTVAYNPDKRSGGSEIIQLNGLAKIVVRRKRSHLEKKNPLKRRDSRSNNREELGLFP
jgi:hypothetical protein